jgi:formylglycine-generating enzyme required for sulfatase activity
VNWLNTSQGHDAAYNFTSGGANDNITLWTTGDAGYDASNPFRNSNAYYFLPSEDEWYRAAYYDPSANGGTGGYWDYATGSDTAPVTTSGGTAAGTAVYRDRVNPNPPGPADITNAGGLSPLGTMGQNGNVFEWGESGFTAPNDSAVERRVIRGGLWGNNSNILVSSYRVNNSPSRESSLVGFRVASVPEPSGVLMTLLGAMGLLLKRRRS